jgi:hypothetical protein
LNPSRTAGIARTGPIRTASGLLTLKEPDKAELSMEYFISMT